MATFPSVQVSDSGIAGHKNFGLGNQIGLPFADIKSANGFTISVEHFDCSFCSVKAPWRTVEL